MNIALDGMPLGSRLTGVGHYTFELARSLALAAPTDSFTLVSPEPPPAAAHEITPKLPNLSFVNLSRAALNRRWWGIGLPLYLSRSSFDLFHGTNYEIPLWTRGCSVVTIHDLSLFLHSEVHEKRLVRRARWRLPLMAKRASKVITPSRSVKTEVCETFGLDPEKVVVTPEAPRSVFRRREDSDPRVIEVRERLGINEDFLLFVGTIEPRKNLRRLVEAFEQLLRSTSLLPKLVIAGGHGWLMDDFAALIRQKKLDDRICLAGYLEDEDLCALYSSCSAFVYPSLYEGFGLPPLEAMACGAPVITSRIPSLIETVGDAAWLVDPHDVEELAQAMAGLLSDEKLRQHYVELGRAQAEKFSWEQTALKTLEVYRSLV